MGGMCVKDNATKVRVIKTKNEEKNKVLCGFAGTTADCLALIDRLEGKLDEYPGQLTR